MTISRPIMSRGFLILMGYVITKIAENR